jgi:hypothetical protein
MPHHDKKKRVLREKNEKTVGREISSFAVGGFILSQVEDLVNGSCVMRD